MVAIVPIRSGSKGIIDKNIKFINGQPLIWWVLNSLQNSNVDKIIVATDEVYAELISDFSFSKVELYERDPENATDHATTESVLLEVINNLNIEDDILLAQATSPLTTSDDFNGGIELYKKYDSVLSVVNQKRFIWDSKGMSVNYNYKNRPRRQDWDGYFVENGAFYISNYARILESENRISGHIGLYEMDEKTYYELDSESDWKIIEKLLIC